MYSQLHTVNRDVNFEDRKGGKNIYKPNFGIQCPTKTEEEKWK